MCRSGKAKFRSCALERGKMGNCGFAGKNWEEVDSMKYYRHDNQVKHSEVKDAPRK